MTREGKPPRRIREAAFLLRLKDPLLTTAKNLDKVYDEDALCRTHLMRRKEATMMLKEMSKKKRLSISLALALGTILPPLGRRRQRGGDSGDYG